MTEAYLTGCFVVAHDPVIKSVGTTTTAHISGMLVETFTTNDIKKEIFSYLDFEVWDKAADYIAANCRKGDTLVVLNSVPRQNKWETEDGVKHSKIIFRIKSFRVIPKKESRI